MRTKTITSSKSNLLKLYDPIRKKWVAGTPEERVRQGLIRAMVEELGYPKELLAVECPLRSIKRRADLVCYYGLELRPLLLLECKALPLLRAGQEQLLGYNTNLGAHFVCLASPKTRLTLWFEEGKIRSVPFLPPYLQLLAFVKQFDITKKR